MWVLHFGDQNAGQATTYPLKYSSRKFKAIKNLLQGVKQMLYMLFIK